LSGDEELRFKCPPKFRSIYMDILAAPEGDFSSDRGRNPIIKIDPLPEFGQNLLPKCSAIFPSVCVRVECPSRTLKSA
jgi:hypothetical protein